MAEQRKHGEPIQEEGGVPSAALLDESKIRSIPKKGGSGQGDGGSRGEGDGSEPSGNRRHGEPVGEGGPPSGALLDESKMRPMPTQERNEAQGGSQRKHGEKTEEGVPSAALLDESKMRKME
eukprot:gb/GECG01012953.1/.p1 GENE.gb/GECG01012953.1/~~gb/GECG01012953.1/.p1  ORF type:complete len:122 (+),score=29.50 gb/GECG01012953.1/:1-366(+)